MENIKQIKTISLALTKEKEKWLFETSKVVALMEKKQFLINKMLEYQKEYDQKNKLELSKSSPLLHKNYDLFYKKMLEALFKAESEYENLKRKKESLLTKVMQLDQKIKVMEVFQGRIEQNEKMTKEQQEQILMNDLALNKLLRGNHE